MVLPAIHSCLVRELRALGAVVEDMDVRVALVSDPQLMARWPRKSSAEFVLSLDLGAVASLSHRIKELQEALGIPWVVWFLDDPEGYGFPESCHPRHTMAFCWDMAVCREMSTRGPMTVHYLPLASDPMVFKATEESRHTTPRLKGVFVGSTCHGNPLLEEAARGCESVRESARRVWERHRRDMTKSLHSLAWQEASTLARDPVWTIRDEPMWRLWVHACLHIAGKLKRMELVRMVLGPEGAVFGDPAWAELLDPGCYLGPVEYGLPLRNVYVSSQFVLEVRQPQSRGGLSQRVFDASACARPVVAEWSLELENIFDMSKEVLSYRNMEEAREAAERCLRCPSEAFRMASLARKVVLDKHTFAHRAKFMMESLLREGGTFEPDHWAA